MATQVNGNLSPREQHLTDRFAAKDIRHEQFLRELGAIKNSRIPHIITEINPISSRPDFLNQEDIFAAHCETFYPTPVGKTSIPLIDIPIRLADGTSRKDKCNRENAINILKNYGVDYNAACLKSMSSWEKFKRGWVSFLNLFSRCFCFTPIKTKLETKLDLMKTNMLNISTQLGSENLTLVQQWLSDSPASRGELGSLLHN